ncbi:hypothetical protein MJM04_30735, partial [Salmonella enterica subsp. enterica serovar Cerro]|nr:hypothetical protein [Salmonella enterica subsp. enterica serovar Cerro]
MVEQRRLASTEWVDIVNEDNEVIAQSSRGSRSRKFYTPSDNFIRISQFIQQGLKGRCYPFHACIGCLTSSS